MIFSDGISLYMGDSFAVKSGMLGAFQESRMVLFQIGDAQSCSDGPVLTDPGVLPASQQGPHGGAAQTEGGTQ